MVLTLKKELVIRIITLLAVVILCLAIYFNGKSLDCDKCEITLKSSKTNFRSVNRNVTQNYTLKLNNIYNSLVENRCALLWDKQRDSFTMIKIVQAEKGQFGIIIMAGIIVYLIKQEEEQDG